MTVPYSIQEGRLADAVAILLAVPEFYDIPEMKTIQHKLSHKPHLVLTAYVEGVMAGCKIGYERDGRFYSWLGAIRPEFRRHHIASALAEYQEAWARDQGYDRIWMKTRNAFPAMLIMAIKRGFRITGLDLRSTVEDHRIILEKKL